MSIFGPPTIPIVEGAPDASTVLNTTGFDSSGGILPNRTDTLLNTLLGRDRAQSFYLDFYNNLLTTANAPAINSLWLVFIQDMPSPAMLDYYRELDNSNLSNAWYQKAAKEGKRLRGIILAQGVKHTGDGNKFSREGYNNTGLWKGVLSNGRSDIDELQISFLESNVSFVDYALRPWSVAVAHRGLTDTSVVANTISVWHLGKMGARVNFARRKVITYHNCFPMSIDQQEYNHSGDDINIKRNVSFGYHYYTMDDADDMVLDLLSYGEHEKGLLAEGKRFLQQQARQAAENLQSQFGANTVSQYLNNIVERGKSFAASVVSNTVQGAVTNVAGGIQGAIDGAIRNVTSQGLAAGNRAVGAVAGATNRAIDGITGSDPNRDTPRNALSGSSSGSRIAGATQNLAQNSSNQRLSDNGYIEKKISEDDTVTFVYREPDEPEEISPFVVDTNRDINPNDTPNFATSDITELADGGIAITRTFSTGGENDDTPRFLAGDELLYYVEKSINEDDVPTYWNTMPNSKPLGGGVGKAENAAADSNISAVENRLFIEKVVQPNDSDASVDLVNYIEKEAQPSDPNLSQSIDFNEKSLPQDDSNPSDSVSFTQNQVNENGSNPSDSISFDKKTIPENDSNPSDSVSFDKKTINENDSNPSDTATAVIKKLESDE